MPEFNDSEYNYAVFDMSREEPNFFGFQNMLNVGARAPDYPLEDLDSGTEVALSSLWSNGPAVLEFGSFT